MKSYQNPQPHAVEQADKKRTPPSNLGATTVIINDPNSKKTKYEKAPKKCIKK